MYLCQAFMLKGVFLELKNNSNNFGSIEGWQEELIKIRGMI